MNCHDAQRTLIQGPEAPADAAASALDHIQSCEACARWVEFERRLARELESSAAPSAALRQRVLALAASASERDLPRRGSMRLKVGFVAGLAIALGLVGVFTTRSEAGTPKSVLAKVRAATVKAKTLAEGARTWKVKGAKLVPPSEAWEIKGGGDRHLVVEGNESGKVPELSLGWEGDLPPEVREQVERMKEDPDAPMIYGTDENGHPLRPEEIQKILKDMQIEVVFSLDEGDYQAVAFGNAPNTLVLTEKGEAVRRSIVRYDSESFLPTEWVREERKNGVWKLLTKKRFTTKA